jgi:hypothetical protein
MITDAGITGDVRNLSARLNQAALEGVQLRPAFVSAWHAWHSLWVQAQLDSTPAPPAITARVRQKVNGWTSIFAAEIPTPVAAGADPLIWPPASVHAEVEKAKTLLGQLDQRLADFQQTDPDAKHIPPQPNPSARRTAIGTLMMDWHSLYTEFQNWIGSSPSELWGATATTCQGYEARALTIAQRAAALGVNVAGIVSQMQTDKPPSLTDTIETVGKFALGGVLLYSLVQVLPSFLGRARRTA